MPSPELNMWAKVYRLAKRDLKTRHYKDNMQGRHNTYMSSTNHWLAQMWFRVYDMEIGGFDWVCIMLEIDANRVRKELRNKELI